MRWHCSIAARVGVGAEDAPRRLSRGARFVRSPINDSTLAAAAPASVARTRLVTSANRRAFASAGRLRRTRTRLVLAARASTTGVRILGHDPHLLSERWAHSADGEGPRALHALEKKCRGPAATPRPTRRARKRKPRRVVALSFKCRALGVRKVELSRTSKNPCEGEPRWPRSSVCRLPCL